MSIWDTSAIIALKESDISRASRLRILGTLRTRAEEGRLCYPPEVVDELERFVDPGGRVEDELAEWARTCAPFATLVPVSFERVREVLARLPTLVDADAEHEAADPYVLAQAVEVRRRGSGVVVVTEDFRDRPSKMSLASACGLFRVPTVRLVAFLADEGLYPSR